MFKKFPKQLVYLVVIVAPFWLLFFNSPFWHGLKLKTMGAAAAAVSIVNAPLKEIQIILSYRKTYAEYQKLQRENFVLRAKSIEFQEALEENRRLERLLNLRKKESLSTMAARVISRDPANWNSSLMINKGAVHGVAAGMPVINALGVAGKVAEAAERSAKVILVNDPGFSVAVIDQRTREAALLTGSLSGECRLSYFPADSDLKVGDIIVTSPLSSTFPEGLLVGEIVEVYPPGGISDVRAAVRPAVDVARIEEVLVVK